MRHPRGKKKKKKKRKGQDDGSVKQATGNVGSS
jgi:hypothetical protein